MSAMASALTSNLFQKNLQDLVKGIRSHKRDANSFISQAIAEIKTELRDRDPFVKAQAARKLTYLQMVGYDVSWASFHFVELMSQPRFAHKRIAYLAASQSFTDDTDVTLLTTNLFKKEFGSPNQYEIGLAMNCLANIVTRELARDLLSDCVMTMQHSRPYVRKKAVLAMYKLYIKYPQGLRLTFDRLKERLDDPESAVVSCAVNVICELANKNPRNYLAMAPKFFRLLTTSSNNWMLIKVVKLLGSLVAEEPRLARKLLEPLATIIQNTAAKSLQFECINTVTLALPYTRRPDGSEARNVPAVVRLCSDHLRVFIEDTDQNLKYLGLVGYVNLMRSHPKAVVEHRELVVQCLADDDVTIRTRALELLAGMVTRRSLVDLVHKLLVHVSIAEGAYRNELVSKILMMCSRDKYAFITDFAWYIAVLVELARVQGTLDPEHAKKIALQLMDVAVRVPVVRAYAVECMLHLIFDTELLVGQTRNAVAEVLLASSWIIGEYAPILNDLCRGNPPRHKSKRERDDGDSESDDSESDDSDEEDSDEEDDGGAYLMDGPGGEQIKSRYRGSQLHKRVVDSLLHARVTQLPSYVQATYMQAVLKVFVDTAEHCENDQLGSVIELICNRLGLFLRSGELEVQERAASFKNLLLEFGILRARAPAAAAPSSSSKKDKRRQNNDSETDDDDSNSKQQQQQQQQQGGGDGTADLLGDIYNYPTGGNANAGGNAFSDPFMDLLALPATGPGSADDAMGDISANATATTTTPTTTTATPTTTTPASNSAAPGAGADAEGGDGMALAIAAAQSALAALKALISEPFYAVGSKAQRRVGVPEGIDLNVPINATALNAIMSLPEPEDVSLNSISFTTLPPSMLAGNNDDFAGDSDDNYGDDEEDEEGRQLRKHAAAVFEGIGSDSIGAMANSGGNNGNRRRSRDQGKRGSRSAPKRSKEDQMFILEDGSKRVMPGDVDVDGIPMIHLSADDLNAEDEDFAGAMRRPGGKRGKKGKKKGKKGKKGKGGGASRAEEVVPMGAVGGSSDEDDSDTAGGRRRGRGNNDGDLGAIDITVPLGEEERIAAMEATHPAAHAAAMESRLAANRTGATRGGANADTNADADGTAAAAAARSGKKGKKAKKGKKGKKNKAAAAAATTASEDALLDFGGDAGEVEAAASAGYADDDLLGVGQSVAAPAPSGGGGNAPSSKGRMWLPLTGAESLSVSYCCVPYSDMTAVRVFVRCDNESSDVVGAVEVTPSLQGAAAESQLSLPHGTGSLSLGDIGGSGSAKAAFDVVFNDVATASSAAAVSPSVHVDVRATVQSLIADQVNAGGEALLMRCSLFQPNVVDAGEFVEMIAAGPSRWVSSASLRIPCSLKGRDAFKALTRLLNAHVVETEGTKAASLLASAPSGVSVAILLKKKKEVLIADVKATLGGVAEAVCNDLSEISL